jgi:hypothetical protein
MKAYYEQLCEMKNDDLVICADAYDTFPLRSSKEFKEMYTKNFSQYDIVTSAETMCIKGICKPLDNWNFFNTIKNQRKYANAVLMCGKVFALRSFWKYALDSNLKDDQICLGNYINLNLHSITIDHEALLMQTSVTRNKQGLVEDIITSYDGKGTCFIHLPALKYFPEQRKIYAELLKSTSLRTQLEHVIETRWATRYVPFELNKFVIKLLFVIGFLILACIFLIIKRK